MNQILKGTDETLNKEALKLKRRKHTKHIMEITKVIDINYLFLLKQIITRNTFK